MEDSGILKFVGRGPTFPSNVGIRTFPHQTYGVSKESPDQFKHKHTIINGNGYLYKHDQAPEFQYRSQQKSIQLATPSSDVKHSLGQEVHHSNPYRHHLKKGRFSEFLDKNAWMKTVCVMTGHERSKRSRQVNNQERSMRIKSLKKPTFYDTNFTYKPQSRLPSLQTIQDLMQEKVRIRNRRNQEAERQKPLSQRKLTDPQTSMIQKETIKTKMTQTTRDWCRSLKKDNLVRKLSMRDGELSKLDSDELVKGQLQEWQRKTCRSNWNHKVQREENVENVEERNEQQA